MADKDVGLWRRAANPLASVIHRGIARLARSVIGNSAKERRAWGEAYAAFAAARYDAALFSEFVLKPAYAAAEAAIGATPANDDEAAVVEARRKVMREHGVLALEDRGDRLAGAKHRTLCALLATPAPDRAALRAKIELLYEEYWRFDDAGGRHRALLDDARRLLDRANASPLALVMVHN